MTSARAISTKRASKSPSAGRAGPLAPPHSTGGAPTPNGAPSGRALPSQDAAWLLGLLQAGDSFYPTGSYAHSFGLEGLVQENVVRDRATLRDFIFLSALPALRHTELPLAAHAWRAFA